MLVDNTDGGTRVTSEGGLVTCGEAAKGALTASGETAWRLWLRSEGEEGSSNVGQEEFEAKWDGS